MPTRDTRPSGNQRHFEQDTLGNRRFEDSVFLTLKMAYSPYAWPVALSILSGFLGRGLLLGSTNIIGIWVDQNCGAPLICRPIPSWLTGFENVDFIWLLGLMTLFGFALSLVFRTFFSRLSARAVSQIYDEVTLRTSRYPMAFFDGTPSGRVITRFSSDYGGVFRLFGGPLAEFLAIVFDLIVMMILMGLASPYFLIFVGLIILVNWVAYRINRDQLRITRRKLSASRSPSIAHFSETAQGVSTIRSFSKEGSFTERFAELDQYYLDKKLNTTKKIIGFSFQMNALSSLLFLITGIASITLLSQGLISLGSLGVAFSLIVLSGNTVQMFFEWLAQFEEAMIGVERMDDYLRRPIETGSFLPETAKFETRHPRSVNSTQPPWEGVSRGRVEFKDVSFRYHDNQTWILKNINFVVEPGEHLGIIGATGSGKSTLIQVLFHLYPIQKGKVLLQGEGPEIQNTKELGRLDSFRRAFAYISQDPTLFCGTLRENLDMSLSMDKNDLLKALHRVGLSGWNLERPIEERGKNLSSGERQLVCMARCLLQDSPVVIMDEATSFVDPQSEELMVKATQEYFSDRTQIIIAHRLSTLKDCHSLLWIDKGQIRAHGPTQKIFKELSQLRFE